MDDCIFCKIVSGKIPCLKIYEDENTLAFLDISKDSVGHTLVVPKKHYNNILDADEKILSHVISAVKKVSKHYAMDCGFEGINVLNNNGEVAGQSVFHLHFHILPQGNALWQNLSLEEQREKLKL